MSRIEMIKPDVPAFTKFVQRIAVPASPVVRAGDWVFVSGLAPVNAETGGYDILPIDQQARRCLERLTQCLDAAGSSLDRVVKCTLYCSNPAYFATINEIYAEYFGDLKPARLFLCTAGWFGPFDLEIDCVALAR
ncbi:2-iminobutanoate/2-iminopropanoate deaminase [Enhydrobacter aerosaccus]|uniref:2-iminobutanoate/2-iminopropanoate deaminase n=1 Tax=Enhydrobacter aerosaccus TaxID=225324 RepID=A0A1T4RIP3_9HYPH|nr:RidA family protein [Enhydrobacter aerosaccus]SKA15852.1 2-iminobutanoate/2-iminopropanoate deaminase [Enhydrobacter aerosaccus]